MNDLNPLASLGLTLPTPMYIFGSVLFGLVGYAVYRHGRKLSRNALIWSGVALMLYPYAVSDTWLLWAIGAGLCGWVYTQWN